MHVLYSQAFLTFLCFSFLYFQQLQNSDEYRPQTKFATSSILWNSRSVETLLKFWNDPNLEHCWIRILCFSHYMNNSWTLRNTDSSTEVYVVRTQAASDVTDSGPEIYSNILLIKI